MRAHLQASAPALRLAALGLAALCGILDGCRSAEPKLYDLQGRPVSEAEPVAYRIAIAPFEIGAALQQRGGVSGIRQTELELHRDLVRALGDMDTASEVFAIASQSSYDAYNEKADLLLLPRLDEAVFRKNGASGRAVLSSALWLLTWIGSMWVEDSSYEAQWVVTYDIVDPHTGAHVDHDIQARSERVSLTFWDRNRPFSGDFFLSLLVPPFLTGDDDARTAQALVQRSASVVAAQLKSYLREELPQREEEHLAEVKLHSPRNGAELSGPVTLQCDLIARGAVTEVILLVNDKPVRKWDESELPGAGEQGRGGRFICPLLVKDLVLEEPGQNMLRVLFSVAGQWASRSILVYKNQDPGEKKAPVEAASLEEAQIHRSEDAP